MIAESLELPGILLLKPKVFQDDRGWFFESWQEERYAQAGLPPRFVQDNVSVSVKGTLRGLHYQYPQPQGKLVTVLAGSVFDVAVDIRLGSPSFGKWVGVELSAKQGHQLWIPPGFAHGFVALEDNTVFAYKCTALYSSQADRNIRWDDPQIKIDWPISSPLLSPKDAAAPQLSECGRENLPAFESDLA